MKIVRLMVVSILSLNTLLCLGDGVIVVAQSAEDAKVLAYAEKVSGDRFTAKGKTPKGARVYAFRKQSKQMLQAIDKGLNDLFAVAKKNGYLSKLKHSDYVIFVARPDVKDDGKGNYSPDIAVPLGQYKDSKYDMGGFVYASGMVVGYTPCAFLIAEHEKDFSRASNVVRFEGEHIVLYHNDRQRYRETADHSKGGFHPIIN